MLAQFHHAIQIVANNPGWLYAAVIQLPKCNALAVHRSVALRLDEDWCDDLRKYMFLHRARIVSCEIVDDEQMMFGAAEHSIWSLEEGE